MEQTVEHQELREYKRTKGNVNIDFTVVRLEDSLLGIGWINGSTNNISKGGLCLETHNASESSINYIVNNTLHLELKIHIPLFPTIKAIGEVMWYKKSNGGNTPGYILGIKFLSLNKNDKKLLLTQVRGNKILTIALTIFSAALFIIIIVMRLMNY